MNALDSSAPSAILAPSAPTASQSYAPTPAELDPMDDDPRYTYEGTDDHWEDRAYPYATKDQRHMLRSERQLIRDFILGFEARQSERGIKTLPPRTHRPGLRRKESS